MSQKTIAVLIALCALGAMIAACNRPNESAPVAVGTYTAPPVTTRAAATKAPAPSLEDLIAKSPGTPARKLDPLTDDGTYLVPSEIKPGTYKVTATSKYGISGYVATCADLACKIDWDGSDYTGMIDNDTISGVGYVVIPQHAVSIEHNRVRLEAVK